MPIASKIQPYTGYFSGWAYEGRALGSTDWDFRSTTYAPLVERILDAYGRYVPKYGALGPRGCGYQLKGQIIPDARGVNRKVVKGNEVTAGPGHAERLRDMFGMPVWTFDDIGQLITALRRSRLSSLKWEHVEDGRTKSRIPNHERDLKRTLTYHAENVKPDLLKGQPRKPILVVEAAGGLNFWETITEPWSVPLYSSGGKGAADLSRALAQQARFQPLHISLVTDLDLDGIQIADRIYEDTMSHVPHSIHGDIEWVRLGVDDALVTRLGLDRDAGQVNKARKVHLRKSLPYTAQAEQWTAEFPEDAKRVFDQLMWDTLDIRQLATTRWNFRQERRDVLDWLDK